MANMARPSFRPYLRDVDPSAWAILEDALMVLGSDSVPVSLPRWPSPVSAELTPIYVPVHVELDGVDD